MAELCCNIGTFSCQQNRRLENAFVEENTADPTPVETKEQDSLIEATSRDHEDEEDSIKQLKQKVRISNTVVYTVKKG